MPMISYAQNSEDVLLNRAFPAPVGSYIDVGAAHPVSHSVTKWFYDRGWSGVNVEPHRGFYDALMADRPRDVNLNVALTDAPGEVTYYEVPGCVGWATTDEGSAERLRAGGQEVVPRTVPALTLAEVCERYVRGPIEFLKIDVEGAERAVLAGGDFRRWRPRVLLIEATEPSGPTPNHGRWEDLVLAADYRFAGFDGLNRYYVRAEDEPLAEKFRVPVNVFDDYVPAELVAARQEAERAVAELRGELEQARGRAAELERLVERVQRAYTALRDDVAANTVARPAYEAAVKMLGQARSDLAALREEVFGPAG